MQETEKAITPHLPRFDGYYRRFSGALFRAEDDPVWLAMPIIEGTPLGDGWTEVKCAVADFTEVETRIKLTLSGSAQALPHVKNLRVAIT